MRREDVYICNILKARPRANRPPESDEIAACEPFLHRQLEAIRPKVVCALGTYSAQLLLRSKEPISRLRGQFFEFRGSKLIATFHPAYLLKEPGREEENLGGCSEDPGLSPRAGYQGLTRMPARAAEPWVGAAMPSAAHDHRDHDQDPQKNVRKQGKVPQQQPFGLSSLRAPVGQVTGSGKPRR